MTSESILWTKFDPLGLSAKDDEVDQPMKMFGRQAFNKAMEDLGEKSGDEEMMKNSQADFEKTKNAGQTGADTLADFADINPVHGFKSAITGKSASGRQLAWWEQTLNALPIGGAMLKAIFKGVKMAKPLKVAASATDDTAQSKLLANSVINNTSTKTTGRTIANSFSEYDIVPYNNSMFKTPGFEKHHAVLNEWAVHNIPGYTGRNAPTMLLTPQNHEATKAVFRKWLKTNYGRPVGVSPNWKNISVSEIMDLNEKMMNAANVPPSTRIQYYELFDVHVLGN